MALGIGDNHQANALYISCSNYLFYACLGRCVVVYLDHNHGLFSYKPSSYSIQMVAGPCDSERLWSEAWKQEETTMKKSRALV